MKTAFVTGGSRGIGLATVLEFAAAGYAVAVGYYNSEESALRICRVIGEHGGVALPVKADLSKNGAGETAVDTVAEQLGHIDVLVANAGIAMIKEFTETTRSDWERILATNLLGVSECCRAAGESMMQRHGGSIVTVSSMWGLRGASCEAAYAASKAAVVSLTQSLAREMGPNGVRINCVAPGFIDTDMNAEVDVDARLEIVRATPLGRIGHPEEVAKAIFFLASEDAAFINGAVLPVDGGYTA